MKIIAIILLIVSSLLHSQGFIIPIQTKKIVIPFQLINNLIFVELEINDTPLTFLLDTGVSQTILFSLEEEEINFKNTERVKFSGLGGNVKIEGYKSLKNKVRITQDLVDFQHTVYIILDTEFNFSEYVGIPVHGIIGYEFFKNNPISIDYINKKIHVYKDQNFFQRKHKKFEEFPISIEINKPYIWGEVELTNQKEKNKLLIDLGNSDPLWLFPTLIKNFIYNRPNIDDFLGRGFNGDILGKRSRIHGFYLNKFQFIKPVTSMPDEFSIQHVNMVDDRKGSIGGEIMRRFYVAFDYPNQKMYLKKNRDYSSEFLFNKSGLDFKHAGKQYVKEYAEVKLPHQTNSDIQSSNSSVSFVQYKFVLKPIFAIAGVRKDSPAYLAGLQKEDILISINGQSTNNLTLAKIMEMMKQEDGKKFNFIIQRNEEILKLHFELKDPIPYLEIP